MRTNDKDLPSENIQKIYEKNPLYILEKIRKEKKDKIHPLSQSPSSNNKVKEIINKAPLFNMKKCESQEQSFKSINLEKHHPEQKTFQNTEELNDKTKESLNSSISNFNNISISNIEENDYCMNQINKNELTSLSQNKNYIKNSIINDNINSNINIKDSRNYLYNVNKGININNKIKKKSAIIFNIEKLLNNLKTYWGSINLQNNLNYLDNIEIAILLNNIIPYINEVMCLEYGNYFFQKFIKKLNVQQKLKIYQIIEPNFINIALNKNGTHSIQSLINVIQSSIEQLALNNLLNKDILSLINDKNAYHIIMKIIIEIPENQRNNINLFIVNNIEKIIINPYGSYCVNKYIVNNTDLNMRSLLIKNMSDNIRSFFFHKCSCSILLLLLKYYGFNSCEFIFQEMVNNLNELIFHPVSNSFVSKLFIYLKNNNPTFLNNIIWNIYKDNKLLKLLLSNANGEKLLNKLMSYSNIPQKEYINEKMNNIDK